MRLQVIADPDAPVWKGYVYGGLMLSGNLIGLLADHQCVTHARMWRCSV